MLLALVVVTGAAGVTGSVEGIDVG